MRLQGPPTITLMVFGPLIPAMWVLGPLGNGITLYSQNPNDKIRMA